MSDGQSVIRLVTDADMPPADQATLTQALHDWGDEHERPLIPALDDVNGDGIVDAYGLDDEGRLVYVSGVAMADTVLTPTGEGFETEPDAEYDEVSP